MSSVTCFECRHFVPDDVGDGSGIGSCAPVIQADPERYPHVSRECEHYQSKYDCQIISGRYVKVAKFERVKGRNGIWRGQLNAECNVLFNEATGVLVAEPYRGGGLDRVADTVDTITGIGQGCLEMQKYPGVVVKAHREKISKKQADNYKSNKERAA